jgi:hypothetical protein
MAEKGSISRRQFVTSAISAAALSSLPAQGVFADLGADETATQVSATSISALDWKNQGIENCGGRSDS